MAFVPCKFIETNQVSKYAYKMNYCYSNERKKKKRIFKIQCKFIENILHDNKMKKERIFFLNMKQTNKKNQLLVPNSIDLIGVKNCEIETLIENKMSKKKCTQ